MKQKLINYLLLLPTLLLGTACSSDNNGGEEDNRIPVVLKAEVYTINSNVATVWSGGQHVGVFMLKKGTNEVMSEYFNKEHIADNRGAMGYLVPADNIPMYYPDDGTEVEFRVYYPYEPNLVTVPATRTFHWAVIEDRHTSQLCLYDGKVMLDVDDVATGGTIVKTVHPGEAANVSMTPTLSEVKVDIHCTDANVKSLTATIQGMATQAKLDVINGKILDRKVESDIPMKTTSTSEGDGSTTHSMSTVIIPGELEQEAILQVIAQITNPETGKTETKEYDPVPVSQMLQVDQEKGEEVEQNTEYTVQAQLTENSTTITTQLTGKKSIVVLKWTEDSEDPTTGVARPDEEE
ncbi:MAG: fimbrillin family protein [Bacteroides sp.]